MKTVAIVQARLASTRLPGKVLLDLCGRPVLSWVIDAARAIPGVDCVVVATSEQRSDDRLAEWCEGYGIVCERGPEHDVLERFRLAASRTDADIIVRITADCPFFDPQVAGMVVALQRRTGADYASNVDPRSWPDGLDCEVFTRAALDAAAAEAETPFDREHVTPFLRANARRFQVERLGCPLPALMTERWTLDRPEDLSLVRAVGQRLADPTRPPGWTEILAILDASPDLRAINRACLAGVPGAGPRPPAMPSTETSAALLERALKVIPLGTQTLSKSHIQYPRGAPLFLSHGDGAHVWDVDGNRYVDLVSALLPVVLGYRDPDIDQAIRRQLGNGISFSLATELEVRLAEELTRVIPAAEQVRFAKNGTDVTSAAVRLARAVTGRERIAVSGYHGWQDWSIGSTDNNRGVPKSVAALTHRFAFNQLDSLRRVLMTHPAEFAAVVVEPVGAIEPDPGYLESLRELVHAHGALLVFDEVVTGFRVALGGAQEYYGVTPDLACFGKAMGNGMPIAALVGRAELMREFDTVFFSGTFGGETLSIAAALAVLDKLQREPIIDRLWQYGEQLCRGATAAIAAQKLDGTVALAGLPPWKTLSFRDHPGGGRQAIKTLFVREMLSRGVLINAGHNVMAALTEDDIDLCLNAWNETLAVVARELERGELDRRLGQDVVRPGLQARAAS